MEAFKPFTKEYINDPRRQAERRVYEELLNCGLPGLFIYEWKRDKSTAEVDFVAWIEGVGLFAIQAKGGRYRYQPEENEWGLREDGDWEKVTSPIRQTWSGTEGLLKSLPRRRGHRTFVLPILLFPDMTEPRAAGLIEADSKGIYVMADERGMADKLVAVAKERGVDFPPDADTIDEDASTITGGRASYRPHFPAGSLPELDGTPVLESDRVDIRHVEHYHHVDQSLHLHFHGPMSPECIAALRSGLGSSKVFSSGE